MNRTTCCRFLALIIALPIACLAMGRGFPVRAYTNDDPSNSTMQLWLGEELSPSKRLSKFEESYILYELADLAAYRPTGEEALEEGVVFNLFTESGIFYRYTFYKGGLVACQVNGETLWYQSGRLNTARMWLISVINYEWAPPADSVRPVPHTNELDNWERFRFTGDRDAPVDIEWLKSQIKQFDPEEDWTVLIEPGNFERNPSYPVTVQDETFRLRLLSMVSDIKFSGASRALHTGGPIFYIWVVKGEERHLYGVSGGEIQNYQTLGLVTIFYDDYTLAEEVNYMLAVEQLRLTEESMKK